MSRWFVRSFLKVVVLLDEKFGTGRRAVGETDGEDGLNWMGLSAMVILVAY